MMYNINITLIYLGQNNYHETHFTYSYLWKTFIIPLLRYFSILQYSDEMGNCLRFVNNERMVKIYECYHHFPLILITYKAEL